MTLLCYAKLCAQTFISTCILIALLPIILPLIFLLYIWGLVIDLLIKLKYGHSAKRISGMEAIFRPDTPNRTAICNIVIRFTGEMDVNMFRSRILKLLDSSAGGAGKNQFNRMAQVISTAFGYTFRKDATNFNIDNHIQIIQLSDLIKLGIEKEINQRNLTANNEYIEDLRSFHNKENVPDWKILMKCLLNEFGSKRIDQKLPQWQLIFLRESPDRYTLLIRFHHSIADGIYFSRFISEEFLDTSPNKIYKYSADRPSKALRCLGVVWSILLIPFTIGMMITQKEGENPLHGPELSGKKKYYMSNAIPLESIKDIRKRTCSTVNGILYSCMSSAFALHFKRRSNVQEFVVARLPVPLQNLKKPVILMNKFALVTLVVPTPTPLGADSLPNSVDDASPKLATCSSLNRLQKMKSLFDAAKKDPTHMSAYYLVKLVCSILPSCSVDLLLTSKNVTLGMSNVPGPQTPIHFNNNAVENLMFWFPTFEPTLGVSISIQSYNGQLRVGLLIDEILLKEENEGDLILQDFENEVKNILRELNSKQNSMKEFTEEILTKIP